MSVKIMGEVWGLALTKSEKWVLMALGDHADHEGRNIYPSLGLIAWKTDLHPRTVERIVASLEERGILVLQEQRPGEANCYQADLSKAPRKPKYRGRKKLRQTEPAAD